MPETLTDFPKYVFRKRRFRWAREQQKLKFANRASETLEILAGNLKKPTFAHP
jgi:hypothetical protein